MKQSFSKARLSFLALIVIISLSTSSCNRGVGCPTNFSIGDVFTDAAEHLIKVAVKL